MSFDNDKRDSSQWYQKELPPDRKKFAKAFKLLEEYSKIPADEVVGHVTAIRDKTFAITPYPCLGLWRFLDLYITATPEYPDIIARLKGGDSLIDVGCCYGQILRQLAFDGAPSANLAGVDLRPEFVEFGYELFRDRDTFEARFATGNILHGDAETPELARLDGQFDIVHAASFFHLFKWDDQVKVGERVVRFFKPDSKKAVLYARQVGSSKPQDVEAHRQDTSDRPYVHSIATVQTLWDAIGAKTGTTWKVTGELFGRTEFDFSDEIIRYQVTKTG